MPTKPLQLNEVVNFVVNLAQRSAQRKAFNIMLPVIKIKATPQWCGYYTRDPYYCQYTRAGTRSMVDKI